MIRSDCRNSMIWVCTVCQRFLWLATRNLTSANSTDPDEKPLKVIHDCITIIDHSNFAYQTLRLKYTSQIVHIQS